MRRRGLLMLGLGALLIVAVHAAGAPSPAALYDGVVVEDPYRYVQPPPGATGDPTTGMDTIDLKDGTPPNVYSATNEQPPQAQVIIQQGSIALPAGTTQIKVVIFPVAPPSPAPPSTLAGNVYQIVLTDQDGTPLFLLPGASATVVLRAPPAVTVGTVYQLTGSAWQALPTQNGGMPDMFAANASSLGEFAVVTQQTTPGPGAGGPGPSVQAVPAQAGGSSGPPILAFVAVALGAAAVILFALAIALGRHERR